MTQNKNILACDNRDFLINNCFVCRRQLVQALLGLILVQDNLFLEVIVVFLEPILGNWFPLASVTTVRHSQNSCEQDQKKPQRGTLLDCLLPRVTV